jgi:hypothetical protein
LKRENINTLPMYLQAHSVEFGLYNFERHIIQHVAELPDYLGIAEIAGGRITVRLNATAPTDDRPFP